MATDDLPGADKKRKETGAVGVLGDGPPTSGVVPTAPPAAPPAGLEKARPGTTAEEPAKKVKKEKKLLQDAHRPLNAWERYRALADVLEEAVDLVDLADHKARFALVIMAALNVVLFFVTARTDLVRDIPPDLQVWLAGYFLLYVLVALYFFLQAIESLRPRKAQPQVRYLGATGLEEHPLGLRFYEDILSRDLEAYRRAWREVHIGQLNNELAVQAHALAEINQAKYAALRRLYMGLRIMTLMAVGFAGIAAASTLVGTAAAGKHGRKTAVLGRPVRLPAIGVREPSGVAFHPQLAHLFVVGDEGSLVELTMAGKLVRSHPVKGNLEDVAVHTPTGDLLLLHEMKSELILYDPAGQWERKRWKLDRAALLGMEPGDKNNGFEGLAFREDPQRPGGGVVYVAHQRLPAMIVTIAFDPARPPGVLGAEVVLARWVLPTHQDLTAVTYVPSLDRLLAIARKDRLLVLRPDGGIESEIPLPGRQQEGLCFDAAGHLWVADDLDRSLLRFDGALSAIEEHLRDAGRLSEDASGLPSTPRS